LNSFQQDGKLELEKLTYSLSSQIWLTEAKQKARSETTREKSNLKFFDAKLRFAQLLF